jgi:hypothetical protein
MDQGIIAVLVVRHLDRQRRDAAQRDPASPTCSRQINAMLISREHTGMGAPGQPHLPSGDGAHVTGSRPKKRKAGSRPWMEMSSRRRASHSVRSSR